MEKNLPNHVEYMLQSNKFDDCVFLLKNEEGKEEKVGAKKNFIFAFSEPLRRMIEESPLAVQGDITIPDVTPTTFRHLLHYIYGGGVTALISLPFEELVEMLEMVEMYLMTEIKPKLISVIYQKLSLDNIIVLLSSPACFQGDEDDWWDVSNWVCYNIAKILNHQDMMKIFPHSWSYILNRPSLNMEEIGLWRTIIEWGKQKIGLHADQNLAELNEQNLNELRKCIAAQLKFTRFGSMKLEEFVKGVVPTDILMSEDVVKICKFFGTQTPIDSENVCGITKRRSKMLHMRKFTWNINDVQCLEPRSQSRKSEQFRVDIYSWVLTCRRHNSSFGVFLKCLDSAVDCEMEFKLILLNKYGKCDLSRLLNHRFTEDAIDWGYDTFTQWEELIKVENGYIQNNSITLMVDIIVLQQSTTSRRGLL